MQQDLLKSTFAELLKQMGNKTIQKDTTLNVYVQLLISAYIFERVDWN